jgi:hypothetical protein
MSKALRTLPRWVFGFLFCFSALAFQMPSHATWESGVEHIITLTQDNQRIFLSISNDGDIVKLCGLEAGAHYDLHLYAGRVGFPLGFSFSEQEPQSHYRFQATSGCAIFNIHRLANTVLLNEVLLTVSKERPTEDPKGGPAMGFPPAISTNSSVGPAELIEDVFIGGGCYEVSGITSTGAAFQNGTFANGLTSIGLDEGVILSTGNINVATGPNNTTSAGTGGGGGGDPDLSQIVGGSPIFDVSIIEFQFEPTDSIITFDYVFASEEYCDWVGSQFNDVFGFFLSGPGINGPYSNNAENIALIPNTTTAVAINSVNHVNNTAFYVGNIPAGSPQFGDPDCAGHPVQGGPSVQDCQFDGYTVVLTAVAEVIPCETYTIKLAIADVFDGLYDSAVFLAANSFNNGGIASGSGVGTEPNTNIIYEGCTGGYFEFVREDGDNSMPLVVTFTISPNSTATPGADYTPIPTTIVIPPGSDNFQLPINVFADGIPEGTESIIIELQNACSCETREIEILIEDPPPIEMDPTEITICEGDDVDLSANASGGVPGNLTYLWSNGANTETITVTPPPIGSAEYYVTVTDDCGNVAVDTASVEILGLPTANISGAGIVCAEGAMDPVDLIITFTGDAPWEVVYTLNGVPQPPITTSDNPYILSVTDPGNYGLQSVESTDGGCEGTVSGNPVINEIVITPDLTPTPILCNGDNNGTVVAIPNGGIPPFGYDWNTGATTPGLTGLGPGTYTVTITDTNGCTGEGSAEIPDVPLLEVSVDNVQEVNCDNPTGNASITASGGTPGYNYFWSNGDNSSNPSNLPPGTYTVTVTDNNGCQTTETVTIDEDLVPPLAVAAPPGIVTCATPIITLDGTGSSTGLDFDYLWTTSGGNIVSGSTTLMPEVDAPGAYTLTVTNTDNGCITSTTVVVTENTVPPVATGAAPPVTCANPEVTINAGASSVGPDFEYQWTTTNGNIVSGDDTLFPVVNQGGSYTLTVTNTDNGCTTDFTVQVDEDTDVPAVSGVAPDLTCVDLVVDIDATASDQGPGLTYNWTTNDGNIVGGFNSLTPTVNEPGTYTLTITNQLNGCVGMGSVIVDEDVAPPNVDAGPDMIINCYNSTVILDGSNSDNGPNYIYNWTTQGGNILNGGNTPTPEVNAPGLYTLTVTNQVNGCVDFAVTTVVQDISPPQALIIPPQTITCFVPEVVIDASPSGASGNIDVDWQTPNGNIVSGGNTLTPTVDAPGTYILTVTNIDNGCPATNVVVVNEDVDDPLVAIAPPLTVTCALTQFPLDGTASEQGPNYSYTWSTNDGNIVLGENTLTPVVNSGGTYLLEIFNPTNNCTGEATIVVPEDTEDPTIDLTPDGLIDCADDEVQISAQIDAGNNPTFQWSTPNGNIVSGANTLNPIVDVAAIYELSVVNMENGCDNVETVEVIEDVTLPDADAGLPATLTCYDPTLVLDGTDSDPNMSYTWDTQDGNILNGANTTTPQVDEPGTYVITVFNPTNSCLSTDTVLIDIDQEIPVAEAGAPQVIGCTSPTVEVDGAGSTAGFGIIYDWTTTSGNIVNGENTPIATVDTSGLYNLVVTDTVNGCFSADTVSVIIDQDVPDVDAGPGDELTCTVSEIVLSGTANGNINRFEYTWTTPTGNIANGNNTLNPTVDEPGVYLLTVVDTLNGCIDTSSVIITQDENIPVAQIQAQGVLNCVTSEITLSGINSTQGPGIEYTWSTTNGNFTGDTTTLTPQVDLPGSYTLIIEDTNNDCIASATLQVFPDTIAPVVTPGTAFVTCANNQVPLAATVGGGLTNISVNWSTGDGSIVSGETTLTPIVEAPGQYEVTVVNNDNGCITTETTQVDADIEAPALSVGNPDILDCGTPTVNLPSSGNGGGDPLAYQWITQDGNILSGGTTNSPTVDLAGTYVLTLTQPK